MRDVRIELQSFLADLLVAEEVVPFIFFLEVPPLPADDQDDEGPQEQGVQGQGPFAEPEGRAHGQMDGGDVRGPVLVMQACPHFQGVFPIRGLVEGQFVGTFMPGRVQTGNPVGVFHAGSKDVVRNAEFHGERTVPGADG